MGDDANRTPDASGQSFWETLARHRRLAVLVDLDGVLIPFAPSLEEAELDQHAAGVLRALDETGVQVVVLSGRPWAALDVLRRFAPRAWWIAEHGAWRCARDGWQAPAVASELGDLDRRLNELVVATLGSRAERKSVSVALHWRQVAEGERGTFIERASAIVDEWLEAQPDFERLDGQHVLEVRHVSANKGAAVAWLRDRLDGDVRLMAVGDEMTDEEAFAALGRDDAPVVVGESVQLSRASWWVEDTQATRALLS